MNKEMELALQDSTELRPFLFIAMLSLKYPRLLLITLWMAVKIMFQVAGEVLGSDILG
jgi:hypothetical protein